MSLPIHVEAYSGYKANERPRQFTLDEQIYEIAAVLERAVIVDALWATVCPGTAPSPVSVLGSIRHSSWERSRAAL
jgi:hypothetical protein